VRPPSPAFVAALLCGAALAALAWERAPELGRAPGGEPAGARVLASGEQAPGASEVGGSRAPSELALDPDGLDPATSSRRTEVSPVARDEPLQVHERGSSGGVPQGSTQPPAGTTGEPSPASGATATGSGGSSTPGTSAPGSDERALAQAPGGSTMSGPLPEPRMLPTSEPTPSTAAAAAAPSGRWWPRRHDAVVALYVERTRAALAGAGPR
jgi:hypothetical protein